MKLLRIKLRQNAANYCREEANGNKMTYPLPPFSTVIGAVHKICGYREYHPLRLSVQGQYASMGRKAYIDHCFLDTVMDDRGILVKRNEGRFYSRHFTVVAKSKKSQGNSFEKGVTIEVVDETLLEEYRQLKRQKKQLSEEKKSQKEAAEATIADAEAQIKQAQQEQDAVPPELNAELAAAKAHKKALLAHYKELEQEQEAAWSHFAVLVTSLKDYEMLYGVELVLHLDSDQDTLADILAHIDDLQALGRSEDFVEVLEAKMVEVHAHPDREYTSPYSGYISRELVEAEAVFPAIKGGIPAGTVYYLNKDYQVQDKKRIFNKIPVLYCGSGYTVDEDSQDILIDEDGLIVQLN